MFLNIGHPKSRDPKHLGPGFRGPEWRQVRLDIDPYVEPDILGSISDMHMVPSGSVDAIYSSHTIEHLFPDDLKKALEECLRVLKPDGILVVACPDLQSAAVEIAKGNLLGTLYESDEGPIAAIDIVYSWRGYLSMRDRREYMAHRTGFTLPVLINCLESIGFRSVFGKRRIALYEMWAIASKSERSQVEMGMLSQIHIPA